MLERAEACFAARDWAAIATILADDTYAEDRRRVVNSGVRHGRDAEIASIQAIAEVGTQKIRSTVIATRGGRLALCRTRLSGRNQRPEAFHTEGLIILEIDADNRIVARIVFDLDDIDAAFAELDARYLAGEAPPSREPGRPSQRSTPGSTGTKSPRRRRTGSTSTTGT